MNKLKHIPTELLPYYTFILNFMAKYGYRGQVHDADDIFQRAALRAYETGSSVDGTNFFAYLRYSTLQFFRDDLPKASYPCVWQSDAMNKHRNDSNPVEMLEAMESIRPLLDSLPDSQREAVLMEYWGIAPESAAKATGRSLMAVYVGRSRGVKTLSELTDQIG